MTDHEQLLLNDVSLDAPWKLIDAFSQIIREHPDEVNKAADIIVAQLKEYGVPAKVHTPDLYLSLPKHAEVRANGQTFKAKPPSYSMNAPDGVSGQLVYVPAFFAKGSEDTFDTVDKEAVDQVDVNGKIVITEGFAMPANVAIFQERGAVGLIAINPGVDIHWGTCTSIWGNPDLRSLERKPRIPALAVNHPDGEKLKALANQSETVTVVTQMEEGWYPSKLPEVRIEGSEEPDKFVLLHGHYDSWDIGIGDNATGDATMLEVARILWNNREKLRRSVRIAWWPGHSTGRYAGSTWYSDEFALDLDENCVAQINCDSPGCRWATEYKDVSLTPETEAFAATVILDVTGQGMQGERAHQAGDYSFNNIGISGYFMLLSTMPDDLRKEKGYYGVGGCGGNIAWHTENDTREIADKDILLKDIKIYLLSVFRNANAPLLPYDWRAATKVFGDVIETYQAAAMDKFDFSPATGANNELEGTLANFYEAVSENLIAAPVANAVLQDLGRILVPINFTQDPRFWHDPALTIPPLPDLAEARNLTDYHGDMLGFAKTELTRGQNRVVATLRQAKRRVEVAIGETGPSKQSQAPEAAGSAA